MTSGRLGNRIWQAIRLPCYRAIGIVTTALMWLMRRLDRRWSANASAALLRRLGPWLSEHRIGRANLRAAFPDKSPQEIERILAGIWDNLGRVAVEFSQLDRITLMPPGGDGDYDVVCDDVTLAKLEAIRKTPIARLCFAAHLANWELGAVAAHHFGLDTTLLYRAPSVPAVSEAVLQMRGGCMGTLVASGFGAPLRLAAALERGGGVGMLVDQHETRGVDVMFFGRPCKASPLLAQLARHFECPIYGMRMIRLPDRNRFSAEISDPIEPVRDADGRIDIRGTTQRITSLIETWVREHPEQWLWLHRRWR